MVRRLRGRGDRNQPGREASPGARSCGDVTGVGDQVALAAAHRCVVDALASGVPFTVTWTQQGFEGGIVAGYFSADVDGARVVRGFQYQDGAPFGAPSSAWWSCRSFVELEQCDAYDDDLCFACSLPLNLGRCDG